MTSTVARMLSVDARDRPASSAARAASAPAESRSSRTASSAASLVATWPPRAFTDVCCPALSAVRRATVSTSAPRSGPAARYGARSEASPESRAPRTALSASAERLDTRSSPSSTWCVWSTQAESSRSTRVLRSVSPTSSASAASTTSAARTSPTFERRSTRLLADDLDQDLLVALAVELAVEDLLPRAEIELALRDRADDLAAHELALEVRVRVVLAGAVVGVGGRARVVRGELLEPLREVLVEARLVVVDEDARRDVHRVDEAEAFLHPALVDRLLHVASDVDVGVLLARVQRDRLAERL